MKLIDRYIISKSIFPFLYCLSIFLVLMVFIDLFENLDVIIKNKVNLLTILHYYLFLLPGFAVQVSSIAILLSSIYILGKLSRFNEIVAMKACGINMSRVIFPFLFLGIIVSLLIIILNETVIPETTLNHNFIKEKYIAGDMNKSEVIRENVALVSYDYSYFVKKYDVEAKKMYDITILRYNSSDELISRLDAKSSVWTGTGWRFYNGHLRKSLDAGDAELINFKEKFIELPEKPDSFARSFSVDLMTYKELKKYITKMKDNGYVPIKEIIMLYNKISVPFANFIVLPVGIPIVLMLSQTGIVGGLVISLLIGFGYKLVFVVGIALGNGGLLPPLIAAWFGNVVFLVVGFVLFKKMKT